MDRGVDAPEDVLRASVPYASVDDVIEEEGADGVEGEPSF